jgi:hypothetical protein
MRKCASPKSRGVIQAIAGLSDQPLDIVRGDLGANRLVPNAHRPQVWVKSGPGRTIVAHQMGRRCIPRKTCSSD